MTRLTTTVLLSLGLAAAAAAQDPKTPPQGFPIASVKDTLVSWSDQYRTRMDAYYPDPTKVTAPKTGWPTVLVIHGKGGRRSNAIIVRRCTFLAERGYVTLAYDVRGDGQTTALNPGKNSGNSSRRILDVAEAYFVAKRNLKGLMDDTRLGITGWSMGGGFSLDAMSFSGQTLPNSTGGFVTKMPKISAAVPDIQVIDRPEDYVPGGVMFQARAAVRIYNSGPTGVLARAIIAGNYAQLRRFYDNNAVQARIARLRQSDVPLLMCYSYADAFHFLNQNIDGLQQLKSTTPRRLHVSTGGHGTPANTLEDNHEEDLVGRWYDRFLKGIQNNVEKEPVYESVVTPSTLSTWLNRGTQLKHRFRSTLRTTTPSSTFYLRKGSTNALGALSTSKPTQNEGPFTIQHRVQANYTAASFLRDQGSPTKVNQAVPFVSVAFELPSANTERELSGRARVAFDVQTKIANLQLSASLYDVPQRGAARWITSGFAAKRGVQAGTHRFNIEFEEVPYVLPAGHRLRLLIHNVPARVNGSLTHFLYVPEFVNEDYKVVTSASSPATLSIPLLSRGQVSLTPRFTRTTVSAGIDTTFQIDAEVSRAFQDYAFVMGISGITPPTTQPVFAHFVRDAFTDISISLFNTPILPNSLGRLNGAGSANPAFKLTDKALLRLLAGVRFQFVAVGADRNNNFWASQPVTLVVDR